MQMTAGTIRREQIPSVCTFKSLHMLVILTQGVLPSTKLWRAWEFMEGSKTMGSNGQVKRLLV